MRQPGEPSVEDILESIKKVIARDNRANVVEQRRQRDGRAAPAAEMTDTPLRPALLADDVLDLAMSAQFLDPQEEEEEPAESGYSALVNADARASMRESLAALAMLAQPSPPPQIVRSGETSLEGLVRELLKPTLAEWLDRNLPSMVEGMVAAEIARIVGKKG